MSTQCCRLCVWASCIRIRKYGRTRVVSTHSCQAPRNNVASAWYYMLNRQRAPISDQLDNLLQFGNMAKSEAQSEFLKTFIECYKENPCLWKVKSRDYTNKVKKKAAYEQLIDVSKQFYVQADKEFVIKKIKSIRDCFRKELKKVETSKRSGTGSDDVYESTLWYFDLLLFTVGQEKTKRSGMEIDDLDYTQSSFDVGEGERDDNQINTLKRRLFETDIAVSVSTKQEKEVADNNDELISKACAALCKESDEYDYLGNIVAAKIRKMSRDQKLYCEMVIHSALMKGAFGKLTEHSKVTED